MMRIFLQRRSVTVEPFVPSEQDTLKVVIVQPNPPLTFLEFASNMRIEAMNRMIETRNIASKIT